MCVSIVICSGKSKESQCSYKSFLNCKTRDIYFSQDRFKINQRQQRENKGNKEEKMKGRSLWATSSALFGSICLLLAKVHQTFTWSHFFFLDTLYMIWITVETAFTLILSHSFVINSVLLSWYSLEACYFTMLWNVNLHCIDDWWITEYEALMENCWQGKTEALGEKTVLAIFIFNLTNDCTILILLLYTITYDLLLHVSTLLRHLQGAFCA